MAAAVAAAALLIGIAAPNPGETLRAFFIAPFSSAWFLGNTLDRATLILTAAAGVTVAFRSGTFNLGGEGQVYLGGLAASAVLLAPTAMGGPAALALAAFAAAAAAGCLAAVSGFLKAKYGVDEMISSFLAASAVSPVVDFLVSGPMRDAGSNLLATARFAEDRMLPRLLPPSELSLSAPLALAALALVALVLDRTATGLRLRISGSNPAFARFAGLRSEKYWTPALACSGALHGLAGFFAVAGTYGLCHRGFSGGIGWNAIAVALIARNVPLALLPAAAVYAWIEAGSDAALLSSGLSFETSAFAQAAVFLLVTARLSLRRFAGLRDLAQRIKAALR
jgi:simple sugar transport system permease protein